MQHFPSPAVALPARLSELARVSRALLRGGWQRLAGGVPMLNSGRNDGPPDLDELWRDFNRKLSGLFGGAGGKPPAPG